MKQCFQFKNDNEYYTFEKDVKSFIDNIHIPKNKVIWCPFDKKESAFVKVLKQSGYKVIYSHIDHNQDFFEYEPQEHYDFIISNPPFKGKANIIRRLKELNKPFAMIFGIQCFNSGGFVRELKSIEDLKFIFLIKRLKFHKGVEDLKLPQPTFHSMGICSLYDDELPGEGEEGKTFEIGE